MITISTSDYIKTKSVNIDGKVYEVRNLGAGDSLDISRLSRGLMKAGRKAEELQNKQVEGNDDVYSEFDKVMDEVETINEKILAIYAKLFTPTDGGNSRELVKTLGTQGVQAMIERIFEDDNK